MIYIRQQVFKTFTTGQSHKGFASSQRSARTHCKTSPGIPGVFKRSTRAGQNWILGRSPSHHVLWNMFPPKKCYHRPMNKSGQQKYEKCNSK